MEKICYNGGFLLNSNDHMRYDHIQENRTLVTYDTNLDW